jgi:hypothetical protein
MIVQKPLEGEILPSLCHIYKAFLYPVSKHCLDVLYAGDYVWEMCSYFHMQISVVMCVLYFYWMYCCVPPWFYLVCE